MRKLLIPFVIVGCLCVVGCQDNRVKRGSSLLRVKTETAKKEFNEAETAEAKVKVAEEYFETAPALVNAIDDYVHGRNPDDK